MLSNEAVRSKLPQSESSKQIDQFRYFKIQLKTTGISTRLRGITTEFVGVYSPEHRAEVYCFRLKFNILLIIIWLCLTRTGNYRIHEIDIGSGLDFPI